MVITSTTNFECLNIKNNIKDKLLTYHFINITSLSIDSHFKF